MRFLPYFCAFSVPFRSLRIVTRIDRHKIDHKTKVFYFAVVRCGCVDGLKAEEKQNAKILQLCTT
jgi:hypothetical protein